MAHEMNMREVFLDTLTMILTDKVPKTEARFIRLVG